jgi:acyl-CoA thioester hydrolase
MMLPTSKPIVHYVHKLRTRYNETDQMGYVYHGRYVEYFEAARTEMIRKMGYPYTRLEEQGIMLPVINVELDYKAPVYYDDMMHVHVYVHEKPSIRLETFYRVTTDRSNVDHVLGKVTLCFIDQETRKPRRAPEDFLLQVMSEVA